MKKTEITIEIPFDKKFFWSGCVGGVEIENDYYIFPRVKKALESCIVAALENKIEESFFCVEVYIPTHEQNVNLTIHVDETDKDIRHALADKIYFVMTDKWQGINWADLYDSFFGCQKCRRSMRSIRVTGWATMGLSTTSMIRVRSL